MKIKDIQFDDNETPTMASFTVTTDEFLTIKNTLGRDITAGTVHLTIADAAALAQTYGKLSHVTGATEHTDAIYDCLTGTLFTRFWDNGVAEVLPL